MSFSTPSAPCEFCNKPASRRIQVSQIDDQVSGWGAAAAAVAPMPSMCPNCYQILIAVLEKVKTRGSWTAMEPNTELLREVQSLKSQLQFLRLWNASLLAERPQSEVMAIATKDQQIFHAHRTILITKSAVFKAMLAEGDTRNMVTDMHAEVLRPFLHFLYTAEVSDEDLAKHAGNLMAAAHKYEIEPLKLACEDYIAKSVTQDTAIDFLQLAASCNSSAIQLAAMKQIKKDFKSFVSREDYRTLKENNPVAIAEALEALAISTQEDETPSPMAPSPVSNSSTIPSTSPSPPIFGAPSQPSKLFNSPFSSMAPAELRHATVPPSSMAPANGFISPFASPPGTPSNLSTSPFRSTPTAPSHLSNSTSPFSSHTPPSNTFSPPFSSLLNASPDNSVPVPTTSRPSPTFRFTNCNPLQNSVHLPRSRQMAPLNTCDLNHPASSHARVGNNSGVAEQHNNTLEARPPSALGSNSGAVFRPATHIEKGGDVKPMFSFGVATLAQRGSSPEQTQPSSFGFAAVPGIFGAAASFDPPTWSRRQ